ncbi:hypothetical protein FKP32DRAFT_1677299 [Trametes sanguinea]|nr:hypothetical protein FKP32DRAFT_1677299 [Trametes sanguinea]
MPPARTRTARFRFCATTAVLANAPTIVDVKVPSPPWRVRSVPTITRQFKANKSSRLGHGQSESESDDEFDGGSDLASSRAGTPGNDGRPSSSGGGSDAVQTPSSEPASFVDLKAHSASSSRKGKGRQVAFRHSSVNSNTSEDVPVSSDSRRGSVAGISTSRGSGGGIPPPTNDATVWTRFGMQNGRPVFIRKHHTSSTVDKDCVTYWWPSYSRAPLAEPPDLGEQKELAIGDVYCNIVLGIDDPQLWVCDAIVDGRPKWDIIAVGDTRKDGRRLIVTAKKKQPSWVSSNWGIKQLLQQQRSATSRA